MFRVGDLSIFAVHWLFVSFLLPVVETLNPLLHDS